MENNIFFYSPRCEHCIRCLNLLKPFSSQISEFMEYVNIHQSRNSLPRHIKRVPTIILNGGEYVFEGKQVYKWIYDFITMIESKQRNKNSSNVIEKKESEPIQNKDDMILNMSSTVVKDGSSSFFSTLGSENLSDNIDFSKVRSIDPSVSKVVLTPETIMNQRNNELQKIIPR